MRSMSPECGFTWHEFNAAHAFLRDEGERYDPAAARPYAWVSGRPVGEGAGVMLRVCTVEKKAFPHGAPLSPFAPRKGTFFRGTKGDKSGSCQN